MHLFLLIFSSISDIFGSKKTVSMAVFLKIDGEVNEKDYN
jgi:hypothetical protein